MASGRRRLSQQGSVSSRDKPPRQPISERRQSTKQSLQNLAKLVQHMPGSGQPQPMMERVTSTHALSPELLQALAQRRRNPHMMIGGASCQLENEVPPATKRLSLLLTMGEQNEITFEGITPLRPAHPLRQNSHPVEPANRVSHSSPLLFIL
ncbi:hypothetical protein Ciccas_004781 [Cichlidogyrus casuarinus]|uniref:Uncharacterized protein n=1 Tax=Cichlidogyrus casuarinus TaxID=1844966 RepID=A0ABD2QAL3_9PLAT